MALAILFHFLFQTSSDILIPIVFGLRVMKNAVMLVLAETLMGLDQAYSEGTMLIIGYQFFLQVWLIDLLDLFICPVHLHSPLPYNRLEVRHLFDSTDD